MATHDTGGRPAVGVAVAALFVIELATRGWR
jgi:hypothetical protein